MVRTQIQRPHLSIGAFVKSPRTRAQPPLSSAPRALRSLIGTFYERPSIAKIPDRPMLIRPSNGRDFCNAEVDCVSFELMRRLGIERAFALDGDFR